MKTCPACSANAFDESTGTCTRCGYADGELNRCPHCGAVARIEGSGPRAVCAVCGGPRIPRNFGGEGAARALKEQRGHIGRAQTASILTVVQAVVAALWAPVGLLLLPSTIVGQAIVVAVALLPLLSALRSRARAKDARAKAEDANERAWHAAAEDVARRARGGVTASELAEKLTIDPAYAEKVLDGLTVNDRTRIDVGDDAEVRYSVTPEAKTRIEAEKEAFAELEAAEAEADAATRKAVR